MNFLLVISTKDKASINFKNSLFDNYKVDQINENTFFLNEDFENKIYIKIINKLHIYILQDELIDSYLSNKKIDQIIFLSRHSTSSEHKPKSMSVHSIGNWGKAELGGLDKTLVKTDPILLRLLLMQLKENKNIDVKKFEVKQEATHHGPYLDISTLFYEIGSKDEDWENKEVSKYMLNILFKTIKNYNKEKVQNENKWIPAVGIGSSHYCTRFNKLTFSKTNKYCFGHVIPSYALEEIEKDPNLIEQAKDKSNAKVSINYMDI